MNCIIDSDRDWIILKQLHWDFKKHYYKDTYGKIGQPRFTRNYLATLTLGSKYYNQLSENSFFYLTLFANLCRS